MDWRRTTMGRLVCDLGAYRGIVERPPNQSQWTARVETRSQTYSSVYDYPSMHEAQQWVERKLTALLQQPRSEQDERG